MGREQNLREKILGLVELAHDSNNSDAIPDFLEEVTDRILALFQQKLEDQRNEMERTVKELESALEGVNHELLNNLMESYCEHGKKHKENCQGCGRTHLETLGGRK